MAHGMNRTLDWDQHCRPVSARMIAPPMAVLRSSVCRRIEQPGLAACDGMQKFDDATRLHRFHQRILAVFQTENAV
jgi:hypothetical protein